MSNTSRGSRKKKLSLVLAALITLSSGSSNAYADTNAIKIEVTTPKEKSVTKFSDVEFNHKYALEIYKLAYNDSIKGYSDGTFKPNNNVKRQEFAAMIVNTLGLKVGATPAQFTDVKTTDWSSKIIATAVTNDLISGKGNGKFGYNENITRQDASIIAVRAIESILSKIELNGYQKPIDINLASDYAKDFLEKAVSLGLIDVESNKVRPKEFITRGELANLMVNMIEHIKGKKLENPIIEIVKYGEWDYESFGTLEVRELSDTRRIKETRPYTELFYIPLTGKEEWGSWGPADLIIRASSNADNYSVEQLLDMGYIKIEKKYAYDPFFKKDMELARLMENIEYRETGVEYVYEFRTKEVSYIKLSSPITTLGDKKDKTLTLLNEEKGVL